MSRRKYAGKGRNMRAVTLPSNWTCGFPATPIPGSCQTSTSGSHSRPFPEVPAVAPSTQSSCRPPPPRRPWSFIAKDEATAQHHEKISRCSAGAPGRTISLRSVGVLPSQIQHRLPFHQPSAGRAGDDRIRSGGVLKDVAADRTDHLMFGARPLPAAFHPHPHRPQQCQTAKHTGEIQDDETGQAGADHREDLSRPTPHGKATTP